MFPDHFSYRMPIRLRKFTSWSWRCEEYPVHVACHLWTILHRCSFSGENSMFLSHDIFAPTLILCKCLHLIVSRRCSWLQRCLMLTQLPTHSSCLQLDVLLPLMSKKWWEFGLVVIYRGCPFLHDSSGCYFAYNCLCYSLSWNVDWQGGGGLAQSSMNFAGEVFWKKAS